MNLAALLSLGLLLSACGGKQSMEGGGEDGEEVGAVQEGGEAEPTPVMAADESEGPVQERLRAKGDTSSGDGRPESYQVKAGDTLWKIAEKSRIYGSGWLYPIIYKANKDVLKDPGQLVAGTTLKIPRNVAGAMMEMAREEAMTGQFLDTSPLPGQAATAVAPPAQGKKAAKGGKGKLIAVLALILAAAGGGAWWWKRRGSVAA